MRTSTICVWAAFSFLAFSSAAQESAAAAPSPTSTEWRDDEANMEVLRLLNESHEKMPFSREVEGVLDEPPLRITWRIGPNLPVAWKGGVAGRIGDEIVITGGLWMPSRENLTRTFHIPAETYREVAPPPVSPQYTQGACDGTYVYVVGGRGSGRAVFRLGRDAQGAWQYEELPPLPDAEGDGRWLGAVGVIPGQWLLLVAGHPTGTPTEQRTAPALPDYRLRLDQPDATWETMAPYPGGPRALLMAATVGGQLYVFGGSHPEPTMRANAVALSQKYGLSAPWGGVPNYRDAYRYDVAADVWTPIRPTPFPVVCGGAVPVKDKYILLMGTADVRTYRVGKTMGRQDPFWAGYGDRILCYDIARDNYSDVGVMPYGVATVPWVLDGDTLYCFGGEPAHGYTMNTENVLQIGTIAWRE